jgi:hypothetical protein
VNVAEEAYSNIGTRYFSSKIHTSNEDEAVLTTLLTGLKFNDIFQMVKNGNIEGLPKEITLSALSSFSHKYGTTPDVSMEQLPRDKREIVGVNLHLNLY